jgi:hypothetical protein
MLLASTPRRETRLAHFLIRELIANRLQFAADNVHVVRGFNADCHAISDNTADDDANVVADDQFLPDFATEY